MKAGDTGTNGLGAPLLISRNSRSPAPSAKPVQEPCWPWSRTGLQRLRMSILGGIAPIMRCGSDSKMASRGSYGSGLAPRPRYGITQLLAQDPAAHGADGLARPAPDVSCALLIQATGQAHSTPSTPRVAASTTSIRIEADRSLTGHWAGG